MGEYRIIFSGEILPGHDPSEVRERLMAALRAAPRDAERLFSGRTVSLKTGLDAAQARHYRRRLPAMGVDVRVETTSGAPAAATATPAAALETQARRYATGSETATGATGTSVGDGERGESAAQALALVESVMADSIVCPKCGHVQPKRNLCQSCGVDMVRVRESAGQAADACAQAVATSPPAEIGRYTASDQPLPAGPDAPPRLIGISFEGRMARLSYVLGGVVVWLVMAFVVLASTALSPILSTLAFAVVMIPTWRLSVMRLHDINWSGWWSLLLPIPAVGSILALVLVFVPGTQGENDYGPQAGSHGWKSVLIGMAVMLVGTSILLPWSLSSYESYRQKALATQLGNESGRYGRAGEA